VHYTSVMFASSSVGWGVRVTALTLALVLPTTVMAGPPQGDAPEGPQPIGTAVILEPPPPTMVAPQLAATPIDERQPFEKKRTAGIVMAGVGFGVFAGSYLFTVGLSSLAPDVSRDDRESWKAPIAGPFIVSSRAEKDQALLALPGVLQLAAFGVGVAGLALIVRAKFQAAGPRLSLGGGGLTFRF
jgi:hypothetical protein